MPERIYHTRRVTAAIAAEKALDVIAEVFNGHTFRFSIHTDSPTVNYSRESAKDAKEILEDETFKKTHRFLVENEFIGLHQLSFKSNKHNGFDLLQGNNDIGLRIRIAKPDGGTRFELDDKPEFENSLLSALHKHFSLRQEILLKTDHLDENTRKLLEVREGTIRDLESAVSKLVSGISSQAEIWNKALSDKLVSLEDHYSQKEISLNEKIGDKENELEGQRQEFQQKKKEFDDRENRVVRRDLLKDIRKLIDDQKSFSLSSETERKRGIVNILCLGGLGTSCSSPRQIGHSVHLKVS